VSDVTRALPRLDPHHLQSLKLTFPYYGRVAVLRTTQPESGRRGYRPDTDVDAGQPAAEAGMRVIPPDHHLWSGYMNGGSTSTKV
jgi:hypothetical protein